MVDKDIFIKENQEEHNLNDVIEWNHSFKGGLSLHYLLIYSVVYGLETKNAFEFGSGSSSKVILKALKHTGGHLTSCNVDKNIDLTDDKFTFLHMSSEEALKKIGNQKFDFVLHDGSHTEEVVQKDLRVIAPLIKQYGILLVHDTQHSSLGNRMKKGLLNGLAGIKYSMITLPYGCGLTLIRIEGNQENGQVKITRKKQASKHYTIPSSL